MGVSSLESTSCRTKNARVEVTSEEEGFTGAWFLSKIIDPFPKKKPNHVYIQYETLLDEKSSKPLKEFVNSSLIRPIPPQEPQNIKSFQLNDVVDAFYKDGWWTGMITNVFQENSRFKVTFSNPPDLIVFGAEDLRVHRVWVRGKWIRPKKQDVSASVVSPDSVGALKGEKRNFDSLNSLDIRMEWKTPSQMERVKRSKRQKVDELEYHTPQRLRSAGRPKSRITEARALAGGSRITEAQALAGDKRVGELEHRTPEELGGKSKVLAIAQISDAETPGGAGDNRVGELEHRTPEELGGKSKVLVIAQMSDAETLGDKSDDAAKCTEVNLVQKDCVTEVPITHYPEKAVIEGSQDEILTHPAEVVLDVCGDQQLVHDPPVEEIKEADQPERHVESTGKRKRGRPPKLQKSPKVGQQKAGKSAKSPEVTERNGGVTSGDMASGEVVLPVVVGLEATNVEGSLFNKEKTGVDKKIVNGLVDKKSKSSSKIEVCTAKKDEFRSKKGMQVLAGKQERDSSKRGRRALNIVAGSQYQDFEDPSVGKIAEANGKDGLVKEAETSTVRLPFNMSDDEPLSMWLEPPKTADAKSASQGTKADQQCTTNCSQDIVIRSSQCNDHILPFAKSSLLWKTIESMQLFRLFPQNPHFRTLFSKKENSREGLAIALMVDFVNVVEKTSTLQPDGPKNIIEDTLETLRELEDNGFDVNVIRDRVVQLLLTKDKREELEAKAKEGTYQIEEEKVEDLNNHIRLLQEELALALSTKAQKDSIVAHLKSTVNDINDSIRNVDLEFKALVAAPWQVG